MKYMYFFLLIPTPFAQADYDFQGQFFMLRLSDCQPHYIFRNNALCLSSWKYLNFEKKILFDNIFQFFLFVTPFYNEVIHLV